MHNLAWNLTTKITCGRGKQGSPGSVCKQFGKKAFLVTCRRKKTRAWILDKSVAALKKAGIVVTI